MKVQVLALIASLTGMSAWAAGTLPTVYDATGNTFGTIYPPGYVVTVVSGWRVIIPVRTASPGQAWTGDMRLLVPAGDGKVYWTGANCSGAAYLDRPYFSMGTVPSVVISGSNGKFYLFLASALAAPSSPVINSVQASEYGQTTCYNDDDPRAWQDLFRSERKIALDVMFPLPWRVSWE